MNQNTIGNIGELVGNILEDVAVIQDQLTPVYIKLDAESGALGTAVIRLSGGSVASAKPFTARGTATFIGDNRLRCVQIALHSASLYFDSMKRKIVMTAPKLLRAQEWRCKSCRSVVMSGLTGADYHVIQRAWELLKAGRVMNAEIRNADGSTSPAPSLKCESCGCDHTEQRKDGKGMLNLAGCESSRAKLEPEASRIDGLRAASIEVGPVDLAAYGLFQAGAAPGVWNPTTTAAQAFCDRVRAAGYEARPLDELMKLPVLTGLATILKPVQSRQFGLVDPAQLSCREAGARSNIADRVTVGA